MILLTFACVFALASVWQDAWHLLKWGNPLGFLFSFIIGAAFGSFANVVIYRLPRKLSIIKPASHCPRCKQPIPPKHNIPILSYFLLRGRSACCGTALPLRYPIVELLAALVMGSLYLLYGWNLEFAFFSFWMILLLILAIIDLEHYRLPNILVGCGTIVTVIWVVFFPEASISTALWGLLAGAIMGGAVIAVSKILRGVPGGMGDWKLSMALGLTFGPWNFIFLYLVAAITAILYFIVMHRRHRDHRLPMGPFFAIGAWVTIWAGDALVRWYSGLILY